MSCFYYNMSSYLNCAFSRNDKTKLFNQPLWIISPHQDSTGVWVSPRWRTVYFYDKRIWKLLCRPAQLVSLDMRYDQCNKTGLFMTSVHFRIYHYSFARYLAYFNVFSVYKVQFGGVLENSCINMYPFSYVLVVCIPTHKTILSQSKWLGVNHSQTAAGVQCTGQLVINQICIVRNGLFKT